MKKATVIALALCATGSFALAQGSGGSGSGGASSGSSGAAGAAPGSVQSGTGGVGTAPSGGVGVPGGTGPGDPTVRPNIPDMRPGNSTLGRELDGNSRTTSPSGSGLSSRPSRLDDAASSATGRSSDPTAPPPGAPRIMVPER
jgi:hypothetical protein